MFSEDLRQAGMSMLKGGLAPKYVRRTVTELEDHFSDIRNALVGQGLSAPEAEKEAAARIGDLRLIVREALGKRELKSLVSLYPRTALLLGPLLTYVLVALAFILLVAGILTIRPIPPGTEPPAAFIALVQGMGLFYMYLLPVLMSVVLLAAATSRCMPVRLTFSGILLIALVGSLLKVTIHEPHAPGEPGSITGIFTLLGYFPGTDIFSLRYLGRDLFRTALTLLLSCAAWWWLGSRIQRALVA